MGIIAPIPIIGGGCVVIPKECRIVGTSKNTDRQTLQLSYYISLGANSEKTVEKVVTL